MSNKIIFPIEYYPDPSTSRPLAGGSMYIGESGTDPEIIDNQKQVTALQENGSQVPISQPISISVGGVPLYNGSPVSLSVSGDYSMKVLDKLGSQVYYIPTNIPAHAEIVSGNPHAVTKTEVGLGNVTDDAQLKASQLSQFVDTSTTEVPSSNAVKVAIAAVSGATELIVTAYGAIGDGVTDDTTAITDCFAAAVDGDTILFPAPSVAYLLTSNVSTTKRVLVTGSGSLIECTGTGSFTFSGPRSTIQDLVMSGDRTAGTEAITISHDHITLRNLKIELFATGIDVTAGAWHNINNIRLRNILTTVIKIGHIIGTVVTDLRYDTDTGSYAEPTRGILLSGEGCNFSDIDIIHAGTCLEITSDALHSPTWSFFNSCSFDTSTHACTITSNIVGKEVKGVMFQHCWFSSHTDNAVEISGTQVVDGITFNGCHFINSAKSGLVISSDAQNVDVNGCIFSANSVGNPGTYASLVASSSGRKNIRNNFFGSWGDLTTTVKADIERIAGDAECVIDGNVALGDYSGGGLIDNGASAVSLGTNFGNLPSVDPIPLSYLETTITDSDTKVPTSGAVVDYVITLGAGDMTKAVYDTNDDGTVNSADTSAALTGAQATAITANTAHAALVVGNPHVVTKAEVALGNVTDVAQIPLSYLETVITDSDTKVPTSGAVVDYVITLGAGDMTKAVYDTNDDGVVGAADTAAALTGAQATAITANTNAIAALGTASTRDAEDTLTDGSNLPDGAAIKTYGDANWSGIGESAVIYLEDYGGAGDDATDNATPFNSAIAALSTYGGIIQLQPGIYRVSGTISVTSDSVTIKGAGQEATTIHATFTAGDILDFDNAGNYEGGGVRDLKITTVSQRSSGAAIKATNLHRMVIRDIAIEDSMYNGIELNAGTENKVAGFRIRSCSNAGLYIYGNMISSYFNTGVIYGANTGILIKRISGGYFSNLDILASVGNGIEFNPDTGETTEHMFFTTVLADTSGNYGYDIKSNGGKVTNLELNSCWASTSTKAGLIVESSNADGININGGVFHNNQEHGILLSSGKNIKINGASCTFNSQAGSALYHGIAVAAGFSYFQIIGCMSGKGNQFATNYQGYGVLVAAGASDHYSIIGNLCEENQTGSISDAGTGTNKSVLGNSDGSGSGGIANVVEDLTPQLGGPLDMNGQTIGGNSEAQLDSAVANTHAQVHTASSHSDISSSGATIDDAVAKRHTLGSDTTLGNMTADINLNVHGLANVTDVSAYTGNDMNLIVGSSRHVHIVYGATPYYDFLPALFSPSGDRTSSLGSAAHEWWDMYAVNIYDDGVLQDTQDDLVVLSQIKGKKLKDGKPHIDERSGFEYIDLASLPPHLTNIDSLRKEIKEENGDLITDAEVNELVKDKDELGWRLKRNSGNFHDLTSGGLRQLDREVISMFELLSSRITKLENKLKRLEAVYSGLHGENK